MIFIGLGSNLGDRKNFLRRAFDELSLFMNNITVSSIYETQALLPEGAPPQWNRPFLNMVLRGKTSLQPGDLLARLKKIETRLGRKKDERWAPREIDLDILAMDQLVLEQGELTIPHLGLTQRDFVLLPLCEIAPQWTYPVPGPLQGMTLSQISDLKKRGTQVRRLDDSVLTPDLMGIINVTPDSFSDGGLHLEPEKALNRALDLINTGAHVLDIGAESTRPGAIPLDPAHEWARLEPILLPIVEAAHQASVKVSLDTRHGATAGLALKLGVDWINDVTGFESDEMKKAIADSPCDLVFMHSLGIPPQRDITLPADLDPVPLLLKWGESQIKTFQEWGVQRERLVFDPGIGFGKSPEQNIQILRRASLFLSLGVRVLVGHSRKSFLNQITSEKFSDRDIETLTLSLELARNHIHYLRVHEVQWHHRAFRTLSLYERQNAPLC